MLGEYVCWVTFTIDLAKIDTFGPHRLLDPKCVCVCVCVEVSKFAEPLTGADPDCGAGVSPHAQGQFDADVLEWCLIPKALTGSSDHTGEFRFA